jgi:hypothetical protein
MVKFLFLFIILTLSATAQLKTVLPVKINLLDESLDIAISQVGVCELTGHNDGTMIEIYLSTVNLKQGNPYCAAGQYWCFVVAAKALNLGIDYIPIKRTGLANDMMNDAILKGEKSVFQPRKHDLIVWRKGRTYFGHIERIFQVESAGWVQTIAFNTTANYEIQKNKEGVFIKRRNIYHSLSRMVVRGLIGFTPI